MRQLFAIRTVFAVFLLLILATGGAMAAPPAQGPPDEVNTQALASTAFTYQGNLKDGSGPATGSYDFEFKLYNDPNAGGQIGGTVPKTGQTVTAGLFSVQLDFGNVFDGTALWLQINVQPAGGGVTPPSARASH